MSRTLDHGVSLGKALDRLVVLESRGAGFHYTSCGIYITGIVTVPKPKDDPTYRCTCGLDEALAIVATSRVGRIIADAVGAARRAPVQGQRGKPDGTIPWATHLEAWKGYEAAGHSQSAERIAERGGFGYGEVQCAIAGHYKLVRNCRTMHPVPAGWEALDGR